jgi:hypothetical protein
MRRAPTPVATLGDLHRPPGWLWVHCTRFDPICQHKAPLAIAPLIIRWGANASSDKLRRCARCTKCGHKGATLQTPSWYSNIVGHQPFPSESSTC